MQVEVVVVNWFGEGVLLAPETSLPLIIHQLFYSLPYTILLELIYLWITDAFFYIQEIFPYMTFHLYMEKDWNTPATLL